MNEDEARKLSQQMIDTWPNGPKGYIWKNELHPLDHASAREAFALMRRNTDRATTAEFHRTYQSIRGRQFVDSQPAYGGPPLATDDARAQATFNRGYAQGIAERNTMNVCRCEWCRIHFHHPAPAYTQPEDAA